MNPGIWIILSDIELFVKAKFLYQKGKKMSVYDEQYLSIAQKILADGFCDQNRTGIASFKLPHQIMQLDLRREFPILTTKKVAFSNAVKEMLWIFKDQSNDVKMLQAAGVHIWDEWMLADGTIGTSYGWIVKEYRQMDRLIESLKHNPQDRRMMINLWQIPFLDTGALYPCCFTSMWDVTNGYLNCMLVQRSGDWALGVPFNTIQYAALTAMLAQVTGHKPGLLTHVINNAHIYVNHADGIRRQLAKRADAFAAPSLWLNKEIQNFYDFTIDDIRLIGYQSHETIKFEVAI
jgi:thymidylate synthase